MTLIKGNQGSGSGIIPWSRPVEWLTLPAVPAQGIVALVAIQPGYDSNFLAMTCAGAYTVDWGDGNIVNYATGVAAYHQYTFSAITSALTAEGFKQVIVQITPQAAQNLTSVNLSTVHNAGNFRGTYGYLDMLINVPNCTALTLGSASDLMNLCQQVIIQGHNLNTLGSLFANFRVLNSVSISNTASIATMSYVFQNCVSLVSVPWFDTTSARDMTGMFYNCSSLLSVPLFNTSSVTTMATMFYNCASLLSVPLFVTSSVTTMTTMFQNCSSLRSVPLFVTSSVTTMATMFRNCTSLRSVPLFDTSSVTTMANMFQNCSSLLSVPLFVTSSVTTMATMFQSCSSLHSVPLFNTSSVTTMANMFDTCASLHSVPLFVTSSVTTMATMFSNCTSLQSIPSFNLISITTLSLFIENCKSLGSSAVTNCKKTISYDSCRLSRSAIQDIFTALGDGTGQTITITNNYGTAAVTAPDRAIATAKNWTVVG